MRVLTRKAVRDLRRQRGQVAAVCLTVALGVALFVASAGAFDNLSSSYARTYGDLGLADLVSTGGDPLAVAAAGRAAGASAVEIRTQADVPMTIEGTRLVGRVVGLMDGGVLDRVRVSAGSSGGVMLERHAADAYGLRPGDTVGVWTGAGWRSLPIDAVVVSPEYLWPARSRQEVFGDPHAFAVLFTTEAFAASLPGGSPQVLVATDRPTAVGRALRAAGATDVVPSDEQPSNATLHEDLGAFADISVAFPLLFLTASGVAAWVALTRRVRVERPVIATFMAGGARRAVVVRHYVEQGAFVGFVGSAIGALLGVALTEAVTRAYTTALGIPDTVVRLHPDLVGIGVLLGTVVGVLAALAPAFAAARTDPAEAMRQQADVRRPGRWSRAVSRVRALPVAGRLALRDVARGPRRAAAAALGSALALVLVLSSVGMMTSMTATLDVQFSQVQREDATVVGAVGHQVGEALARLPGVAEVEPVQTGQVTVTAGGRSYATTVVGFQPTTTMHGFRATDGSWVALPSDGLLAGAALADRLHVRVGDVLRVDGRPAVLAGLLDEPLGTTVYGTASTVVRLLPPPETQTWLVRLEAGADRDALRRTVTEIDGVLAYTDADAAVRVISEYLGLFWAFAVVMVLLGGVLALAVIHVSMTVSIAEREGEIATLRAAGVPVRRVARVVAASNLVAAALGVPVGLVAGHLAGAWFMGTFSSDLFHIPYVIPWWLSALAALGVLTGAWGSQWTAVRGVLRVDVARVVRERAL